jgi:hypothetical protein
MKFGVFLPVSGKVAAGGGEVLAEAGQEAEAVKRLQEFIDGNCARADKEYRMLNQTLPVLLETAGSGICLPTTSGNGRPSTGFRCHRRPQGAGEL